MSLLMMILMAGGVSGPVELGFAAGPVANTGYVPVSSEISFTCDGTAMTAVGNLYVDHTATGTNGGVGISIKLQRWDGAVWVDVGTASANSTETYDSEIGSYVYEQGVFYVNFTETPAAGTYTYRVVANKITGAKVGSVSGSLALEP